MNKNALEESISVLDVCEDLGRISPSRIYLLLKNLKKLLKYTCYIILYVTDVQYSDSQFLTVILHLELL